MLNVWPAPRPLKAVSSSPTRATAPPICQMGKLVSGDSIRDRVLDGDVDHVVGELGHVAGAEVVPPAMRERGVEHRLVVEERLRRAQVEHR